MPANERESQKPDPLAELADDPFPSLIETIILNVCGRADMSNDTAFVVWLRKQLTAKLVGAQTEHAAWRGRAWLAEKRLADFDVVIAAIRVAMADSNASGGYLNVRIPVDLARDLAVNRAHQWSPDGERCIVCGAKDWMGVKCSDAQQESRP